MASFRDIRNLLVESFDDDDISEDEFLLLCDANTSKNPDFPYDCYGSFDLNDMDDSECLAEFRFHKNDVPVLLEALQLPQSFTRVVIKGQNYPRYCRVSVELGRGKSLIYITVE